MSAHIRIAVLGEATINNALGFVEAHGDVSQKAFFESLRQSQDNGQAAIEYAAFLAARLNASGRISNTKFVAFCGSVGLNYLQAERMYGQLLKQATDCGFDLDETATHFWKK